MLELGLNIVLRLVHLGEACLILVDEPITLSQLFGLPQHLLLRGGDILNVLQMHIFE